MPKSRTKSEVLGEWERLLTPLATNREALAHVEVSRAKLEALLARAVSLRGEQAAQRAAKQETARQLDALLPEGQRLAALLRQAVREHYGPRAEKLAEFAIQPFRGRPRKPAPPVPGPPAPGPIEPGAPSPEPASPPPVPLPEATSGNGR